MESLTKIVATMGPSVEDPEKIRRLIDAGMDAARINFSHGDHDTHRKMARWVREAAADAGKPIAIIQDIQGPKLRVGRFPGGFTILEGGQTVRLIKGLGEAEPGSVYMDYEHLLEDLQEGEPVLLADGLIRLRVTQQNPDSLEAVVEQGGVLLDCKGVAFPETVLRVPAVTPKDREDLAFGAEIGVDYVAASFVRTAADIREIRELSGGTRVIAKIELAAAYANLDEILTEAAGVMVARGDLGVQLPLETIPLVQADILSRTNAAGLISITATEMLESMTKSPRPTRAEVTDVANAVLQGTDAVMLSAETAIGEYPIETVETMSRICHEVESGLTHNKIPMGYIASRYKISSAVAYSAVEAASNLDVKTIVAFTESGLTARLLSKYRPAARIVAFTAVDKTLARMALYRGVVAHPFGRSDYTDVMMTAAEVFLETEGICEQGETVVMVAGTPPNRKATTNLMKIHVIGESGS